MRAASWKRIQQLKIAGALVVVALGASGLAAQDFAPPERITDSSEPFRLTRNPSRVLSADSTGRLHLVYWAGGFVSNPVTPSSVYYRTWTIGQGWSDALEVDADSMADPGDGMTKVGGRQPSLAVGPDDTVWIAWQDSRHTIDDGNFIDNLEIYAAARPAGSSFGPDIRITDTNAGTLGDNGYTPRVAVHDDGRVTILWYDFHANPTRSDLYVKRSDSAGVFDPAQTMTSMRLTDETERPTGENASYSVPDMVIGDDGREYAVWTSGFSASGPLHFAEIPDPTSLIPLGDVETLATADTGSYFDPAKLVASPDGDLWVTYTDLAASPRNVMARRKASGASTFDAPMALRVSGSVHAFGLTAVADDDGNLHCAWVERIGSDTTQQTVWYGLFDVSALEFTTEQQLTPDAGAFERPSIAINGDGEPFVVFEERLTSSSGDIWFARLEVDPPASARGWELYR